LDGEENAAQGKAKIVLNKRVNEKCLKFMRK